MIPRRPVISSRMTFPADRLCGLRIAEPEVRAQPAVAGALPVPEAPAAIEPSRQSEQPTAGWGAPRYLWPAPHLSWSSGAEVAWCAVTTSRSERVCRWRRHNRCHHCRLH